MTRVLALIALLTPALASANYIGGRELTVMYGSGNIKLGVKNPPSDTCHHYGYHFAFDATTDAGKNMFSILLAAQLSGKKVEIWYSPSGRPGTDHSNGCSASEMAILTNIGLKSQ